MMSSSTLSVNAVEFVPQTTSNCKTVSAVIFEAVNTLICSPEEFYEVANWLTAQLAELIQDDATLTVVVDDLVDQGLSHDNFQYQAARVCAFLHDNLPKEVGKVFRTGLLARCKQEFDRKDEMIQKQGGISTLVRFTLLMGELMLQLKVSGKTIELFPSKVIELLMCLLSNISSDEAVRGVVHTFKLTGATLEKHESVKVQELFSRIKKHVVETKSLTPSQRRMLLTITELRAENSLEKSIDETSSSLAAANISDHVEASAYDPDLYYESSSDEETLERIMYNYNEGDFEIINHGDEQYVVTRDMDPEVEDAFEYFASQNNL